MIKENTNVQNDFLEDNIEVESNNFVPEVDYIKAISKELNFKDFQVKVVLDLIRE
jgi:hypothetical protein